MWQTISYYVLLALESVVGVFGIRLYEEPTYEVIARASDRVEIRRYAPRLAAEVAVKGTDKEVTRRRLSTPVRLYLGRQQRRLRSRQDCHDCPRLRAGA